MKEVFSYKGYSGSMEFSLADKCLHGKILFVNDLVTYQADTLQQLEIEFQAAVDDYLETCEEIGVSPDKPYSGTFNIRIGPELHQAAVKVAFLEGVTLNEFSRLAIKERVERHGKEAVHHHYHIAYHQQIQLPEGPANHFNEGEFILEHMATRQHRALSN